MNLDELTAALNHQITDEDGNLTQEEGELPTGESAPQEEKPTKTQEPPEEEEEEGQESPKSQPRKQEPSDEEELGEAIDDQGNRYVPEKRFKAIYKQAKEAQRRAEALQKRIEANQGNIGTPAEDTAGESASREFPATMSKADLLEAEMLYQNMPQFDPTSDSYSEELDELAASIFMANPTMTKLEAARRAINMAKKLSNKEVFVRSEARNLKREQADQGITSRVVQRREKSIDPNSMSLEQMEAYMKETGDWDRKY